MYELALAHSYIGMPSISACAYVLMGIGIGTFIWLPMKIFEFNCSYIGIGTFIHRRPISADDGRRGESFSSCQAANELVRLYAPHNFCLMIDLLLEEFVESIATQNITQFETYARIQTYLLEKIGIKNLVKTLRDVGKSDQKCLSTRQDWLGPVSRTVHSAKGT